MTGGLRCLGVILALLPASARAALPAGCPSFATPEAAHPWSVDAVDAPALVATAHALAEAWDDGSCAPVDCRTGAYPDDTACQETTCLTASGVSLHRLYREWSEASDCPPWDTRHSYDILEIGPPAGAASWTALSVEQAALDGDCGKSWTSGRTDVIRWAGTLGDEAPGAYTLVRTADSGGGPSSQFARERVEVTAPDCEWVTTRDHQLLAESLPYTTDYVVSGPDEVVVEYPYPACEGAPSMGLATLNDTPRGVVDGVTWATLGADFDADGFPPELDCDDADATVNPCAEESPYDGIDQDCDGADLVDVDRDDFVAAEAGGDDCDDADAGAHPGAPESPYDGIDQDCDGADLVDVDRDGFPAVEAGGDDCNDASGAIHPGAEDLPNDGVDQDCDGVYATEDRTTDDTAPAAVPDGTVGPEEGCGCGGDGRASWTAALLALAAARRRRALRLPQPSDRTTRNPR